MELRSTKKFSVFESCSNAFPVSTVVLIQYACSYTHNILLKLLRKSKGIKVTEDYEEINKICGAIQFCDFEFIQWEDVLDTNLRHRAASYLVRKGLSRKAQFSSQLRRYCSKHADSVLNYSVPYTLVVETWDAFEMSKNVNFGGNVYGNFDESFVNSYFQQIPLRDRMHTALEALSIEEQMNERKCPIWILKPSVTNKGQDISIITNYNLLLDKLISIPDIREWVLQEYISQPLLLNKKKFHFRVYVLSSGAIEVYVYNQMLILIAAHTYDTQDLDDIYKHLTNTARSVEDDSFIESENVKEINDLSNLLQSEYNYSVADADAVVLSIKHQIYDITRYELSLLLFRIMCLFL